MSNTLKVNEIFNSIQGEGRFQGFPVVFIRLSGCNLKCEWCDTKYHINGTSIKVEELKQQLENNLPSGSIVVITGGEPLLQYSNLLSLIKSLKSKKFVWMLETNGVLINKSNIKTLIKYFDYISVSPKSQPVAYKIWKLRSSLKNKEVIDIKVVTDLKKVGLLLIEYATTLMPLTVSSKEKSLEISQKVWDYCVKHNLHFSSRLHYLIWGNKRKK